MFAWRIDFWIVRKYKTDGKEEEEEEEEEEEGVEVEVEEEEREREREKEEEKGKRVANSFFRADRIQVIWSAP